jgi:hypothetical protein
MVMGSRFGLRVSEQATGFHFQAFGATQRA